MSYFPTIDINQNVTSDSNNSSTVNLSGSSAFTGSATSTLGVNALQISLKTDQNCTVYVDQSPDGTNWDINDVYNYYTTNTGFGITVQAINSYYRVRVKNISSTNTLTTYFRLQSVLCPVVEAVPRSLDAYGNLKTSVQYLGDTYGFSAECTPHNELRVIEPVRLVGAMFSSGTTIDSNFWTTSSYLNSTASQATGSITLNVISSSASASLYTPHIARFVYGSSNRFRNSIQLSDTGSSNINVTRRWGAYNSTDGAFYELSGSTFNIVTRIQGIDTRVPYSSFNGVNILPTFTNTNIFEIYYAVSHVYFSFKDQILHTVTDTTLPWTNNIHLPARAEIINGSTAGSNISSSLSIRGMAISRLGRFETQPDYLHISASGTFVLKYSPGVLRKIVINNPVDCTITVYDNTTNSGNTIATISTYTAGGSNAVEPFYLEYGTTFNNGLTINTSNTIDITVIYE